MVSSSISALCHSFSQISCTNLYVCEKPSNPLKKLVQIKSYKKPITVYSSSSDQGSSPLQSRRVLLHSSVALAASAAVLFRSNPGIQLLTSSITCFFNFLSFSLSVE